MKKRFLLLCCTSALLALGGCTTYVTVESNPEGATITDLRDNRVFGTAPVSIPYKTKELRAMRKDEGSAKIPGFMATWPSGAKAQSKSPIVLDDLYDNKTVIMIERPEKAPDLVKDLDFALKQAQKRADEAQKEEERLRREREYSPWWGWGWGPGGWHWNLGWGWGFYY